MKHADRKTRRLFWFVTIPLCATLLVLLMAVDDTPPVAPEDPNAVGTTGDPLRLGGADENVFPPAEWSEWNLGVGGDCRLPSDRLRGAKLRPLYVAGDPMLEQESEEEQALILVSKNEFQRVLEFFRVTEPEMIAEFEAGWRGGWFKVVELLGGDPVLLGQVDYGQRPTFGIRLVERCSECDAGADDRMEWRSLWDLAETWVHERTHFFLYGTQGLTQLLEWKAEDARYLELNRELQCSEPGIGHVTFEKIHEHREVFEACLTVLQRRAKYALEHGEELLPRRIWQRLLHDYRLSSRLVGGTPVAFPDEPEWVG